MQLMALITIAVDIVEYFSELMSNWANGVLGCSDIVDFGFTFKSDCKLYLSTAVLVSLHV
jgi:hypothetical protein